MAIDSQLAMNNDIGAETRECISFDNLLLIAYVSVWKACRGTTEWALHSTVHAVYGPTDITIDTIEIALSPISRSVRVRVFDAATTPSRLYQLVHATY